MNRKFLPVLICIALISCSPENSSKNQNYTAVQETDTIHNNRITLPAETYRNKVLGMLVGSAIGDAMGAPTEMWSRPDIRFDYGFIDKMDTMVRSPSPEGTWVYNLPAGGSTDDTRWKKIMVDFSLTQHWPELSPFDFASFILTEYKEGIGKLKNTKGLNPEPYEDHMREMTFLQEWALVAKPFTEKNMIEYSNALSHFYGGEMTCAGMLYSPVIGACIPGDALTAYKKAYDLAIFDIGYARDLTALVAAMTSAAFQLNANSRTLLNTIRDIDPKGYFKSRLVGRSAYRFFRQAREIVFKVQQLTPDDIDKNFEPPKGWNINDTLSNYKLITAFSLLDKYNEDMPFHPGEIFLTVLTGMIYAEFDFQKTMEFIVNYGRDNDTAAAIAGAILGAFYGADKLPARQVKESIRVNRNVLGIDLPELAAKLTDKLYN